MIWWIFYSYHQYVPSNPNGEPVIVALYCDGRSCEITEGAQEARLNGADKWTRIQGLEPRIQEWHRRQLQLQDCYDALFKQDYHRDKGTLYHLKQYQTPPHVTAQHTPKSASQVIIMSTISIQNTSRGIVTIMYICIFIFQTFKASHMPATWVGPTDQNLGEIRGIQHDQRINVHSHSDYYKMTPSHQIFTQMKPFFGILIIM